MRIINKHIGELNKNKHGTIMKVIEYNRSSDIIVEFQDNYKYKKNTSYINFKNGTVKNPYDKTICGIACIGDEKWKVSKNNKLFKEYKTWHNMIGRCYDPKWNLLQHSYKGCTVCNEWLNYQNFRNWWEDNYYDIKTEKMCLDKDILHKGNKEYSPENCIFVPQRINLLLINRKAKRGNTPLGVKKINNNKYVVSTSNKNGKNVHLKGVFNNEIDAFYTYKSYREQVIKEVADEYKDKIPKKLYDALYNWKIEITD